MSSNMLRSESKQKKKLKCPPKSDNNQKDIRSCFAATPRQATKKPRNRRAQMS